MNRERFLGECTINCPLLVRSTNVEFPTYTKGAASAERVRMTVPFRSVLVVVISSLLLARGAVPRAQDQSARPTFRTGANYVRVDVYPTRNGTAVTDLTSA